MHKSPWRLAVGSIRGNIDRLICPLSQAILLLLWRALACSQAEWNGVLGLPNYQRIDWMYLNFLGIQKQPV